jgi:hypothetical protein
MTSEEEVLLAEAMLGRDAEDFINSDIGRYLLGRAEQEAAEASELLAKVNPWRRNRIRQLQNEIWRAQSIRGWLAEMVTSGKAAFHALDT